MVDESESLGGANRHVDDLISQGHFILDSIRDQRMALKGIQVKLIVLF